MSFLSLVRPILEYACPVWSPYLVKDKLAIEKVQRRASRIALGQKFIFSKLSLRPAVLPKSTAICNPIFTEERSKHGRLVSAN